MNEQLQQVLHTSLVPVRPEVGGSSCLYQRPLGGHGVASATRKRSYHPHEASGAGLGLGWLTWKVCRRPEWLWRSTSGPTWSHSRRLWVHRGAPWRKAVGGTGHNKLIAVLRPLSHSNWRTSVSGWQKRCWAGAHREAHAGSDRAKDGRTSRGPGKPIVLAFLVDFDSAWASHVCAFRGIVRRNARSDSKSRCMTASLSCFCLASVYQPGTLG